MILVPFIFISPRSIPGQTTTPPQSPPQSPNLVKETMPLPSIFPTVCCIIISILDMYTDIAQGVIHFNNRKRWYGHLTLTLVIAPAFINSIYTAFMFYSNKGKIVLGVRYPYPVLVYILCFFLHGHIARQIVWIYAIRTKALNGRLAKELVSTNRDMSFYLEVFLESLPQMWLQLYVMIVIYGEPRIFGLVTLFTSFMAASWGLLLLFDTGTSKLFAFQINVFWMSSRVLSLAVFASIARYAPFVLLTGHYLAVLPLWFYEIKKHPFERRGQRHGMCHTLVSDFFFATMYAVCNTVTPMITRYYFALSCIFMLENIGCCIGVYYFGEIRRIVTNGIRQNIAFRDWKYSFWFVALFYLVTGVAIVQTTILFLLKYRNVVSANFMQSNILKVIQQIQPIKALRKTIKYKRKNDTVRGTQPHRDVKPCQNEGFD